MRHPGALVAGGGTLALVAAACALAWQDGSPLVPREGGSATGSAALFLILLVAAFTADLAGL